MREQIAQLTADNRLGTARNYMRTLRSFSGFLGGGELPFAAFTERLVEEYNAYLLRRGVVRNTVSFYMRSCARFTTRRSAGGWPSRRRRSAVSIRASTARANGPSTSGSSLV